MIDFSSILMSANKNKDAWNTAFPTLNIQICDIIDGVKDYDAGVENWAMYRIGGEVALYACSKYPIFAYLSNFDRISAPEFVEKIQLDSFSENVFSCNMDIIALAFGGHSADRLRAINKSRYSLEDIWWSTVT